MNVGTKGSVNMKLLKSREDKGGLIMTEARANDIFRTKYPEGKITRKNASSAG